jgi:hypothetical protein
VRNRARQRGYLVTQIPNPISATPLSLSDWKNHFFLTDELLQCATRRPKAGNQKTTTPALAFVFVDFFLECSQGLISCFVADQIFHHFAIYFQSPGKMPSRFSFSAVVYESGFLPVG